MGGEGACRACASDGSLRGIRFIAFRLILLFRAVGGCGWFRPTFLVGG